MSRIMLIVGMMAMAAGTAQADDTWRQLGSTRGGGAGSGTNHLEFTVERSSAVRFGWKTTPQGDERNQAMFQARLEKAEAFGRENRVRWQNVAPICRVHAASSDSGQANLPAGRYRVRMIYRVMAYEFAVEARQ